MSLLSWNSSYSVGIDSIDAQHNVLFQSLNDLHRAMLQGEGREVTAALLRELLGYLRNHFFTEEALLARNAYPKLAEHHQFHLELTNQLHDYVQRLERGEPAISTNLVGFLRNWLTNHIKRQDRAYSSWLAQRGLR